MACSLQLAVLMFAAVALGFGVRAGAAELCSEYYDQTCPDVHRVVRRVLKKAHEADVRIYASLTRLHFHDCFVQVKKSSRPVPCSADGHDAGRLRRLPCPARAAAPHHTYVRSEPAGMCLFLGRQGCDGSILLDNSSSIVSEKFATPNNNSARGYPVVDAVKAALEEACPGVVSCADILAIAAKISVELVSFF
jgi:peroxidase